jgi:SulP family sulfate permease
VQGRRGVFDGGSALKFGEHTFDRMELAGSLGDLGTLIPLSIALIVVNGLSLTTVFLGVGLFYIGSGLYFKLPVPVQPLKLVSAVAVAYPEKITLAVIAAAGIIFGVTLILFSISGLIDRLAKWFTKPIIRGIQLGLGLLLIDKGIDFILSRQLSLQQSELVSGAGTLAINPVIGIAGGVLTLLLISSRRFPAALVLVSLGMALGILLGNLKASALALGPSPVQLYWPRPTEFLDALLLLVIPQIPLTLGNAVVGTTDTCRSLFGNGRRTQKATNRGFALSMGLANLATGFMGGMPMCHGAGGLAAHYRFGARTGGANLMIGILFLIIAIFFGKAGVSLLCALPTGVFGVLLVFAGLELALLVRDLKARTDLFLTLLVAGIGFATTNMAAAFIGGIVIGKLIDWQNLEV